MERMTVPSKEVQKFEKFIDEKLKVDLEHVLEPRAKVHDEMKE